MTPEELKPISDKLRVIRNRIIDLQVLFEQGKLTKEYFAEPSIQLDEIADELQQYATQREAWISVEDRLPHYRLPVLILTDYGKMATAFINDESKPTYGWIDSMRQEHSYGSVTHWQLLPSPPKSNH